MLLLSLTGGAALSFLTLQGWERERVADALMLLMTDPRPPFARSLQYMPGEAFEIWVGSERRVHYRIYKDDANDDAVVGVFRIV